jgi:CxxC motif-containing protein (DUF1111 family)
MKQGRKLFTDIGCAVCHRQELGGVEGIYSDLLLHDMGPETTDFGSYTVIEPVIASKDRPGGEQPRPASGTEWRTPPLWGLRDSAPYLHDGRAKTIAEAIHLHGGEGLTAAQKFQQLPSGEQHRLEAFLQTLVAPSPGS